MLKKIAFTTLAAALLSTMTAASDDPPQVPETPADVNKVLYVEPFVLEQGTEYVWCKEKPVIQAGYLLVLEVNPDLVYPRQTAEPVLYVGKQTAQRVNLGHESGRVIAIAPSTLDENGKLEVDLAKARIWFGTPELPELVTARRAAYEHNIAAKRGIQPRGADEIAKAAGRTRGQATVLADGHALMRRAGEIVRRFSPQDKEIYEALLLPQNK